MFLHYPLGGIAEPRIAARTIGHRGAMPTCAPPLDVKERGLRATRRPAATRRIEKMATFIMLTRLTPDGVKTIKDNPSRVHEVTKEVEQLGVKVLNQWATLGEYDFVSVVEAPDEKVMAKLSIEMGSRGTVMNETLTAIDVEEFTAAL
jgi:uncharacterized protein with GYD domain